MDSHLFQNQVTVVLTCDDGVHTFVEKGHGGCAGEGTKRRENSDELCALHLKKHGHVSNGSMTTQVGKSHRIWLRPLAQSPPFPVPRWARVAVLALVQATGIWYLCLVCEAQRLLSHLSHQML